MDQYPKLIILVVSTIISIPVTIFSIALSRRLGFLDKPEIEKHKAHKKPIPLAGGISMLITLGIILLLFGKYWADLGISSPLFVTGALIIFIIGLLDDIFIFSPPIKMLGQILGAALVIASGFSITLFLSPVINIGITLIWFVGIINAFNFLDGSDGMILECGIVIAGFSIIFTYLSGQPSLQIFTISLVGLLFGLLIYNFRPAKMFMGDAGSQLLGLLLAAIVLKYNPLGFDNTSSWITPILMMSVPIFDVTLVVISRIRRNTPITRGGLDHTFHRLVIKGVPPQYATIIIVATVMITNSLAHLTLIINRDYAYIVFGFAVITAILMIYWLEKSFQPQE
jgi:UDP-GlcNAc:undecaprenyl-phosphate GlcNAc-1-phosphate transferase